MLKIPARFKQYDLSVSLACNYCDCYFNMGTRAAAFTVKIRSLYDYQLRLLHGIMPLPSGIDIANTIKYFSQTLLTVLKDVPDFPLELLKSPEKDSIRMGLFPNLDYKGLYNSLIPLMEVAPLIQYGLEAFGHSILQCLGCLLPFLEHDLIDNLPYLTASSIAILPRTLHQDIVNYLCYYIFPFTITRHSGNDEEQNVSNSVASAIMMVFQYSNNPAHHCQLLESLMTLKQNVLKDLLCVIAYGTPAARSSSAKLLFYYWPAFNPNLFDRKNLICKFAGDATPFVCQRDMCPNAGNAEAAKVCYDHCISITFASDSPPPLYLCIECANEIHREHPNQMFFDILHPMQQVSMVCENKNCRATDKYAVSICFSTECASYNGNHPIRYCQQCHSNRHNNRRGGDHIVHKSLPPTWTMDTEMQTYMVEAIVSLLKEAKAPNVEMKDSLMNEGKPLSIAPNNISFEERQLLGRYGVWLLVGRCTPYEDTPYEILGRLIAMLFHWFHVTAYSYDGHEEGTLEKLKTEYVCSWLQGIRTTHYNLFLSCLLPHPPEYARVGGHWDTLASRTSHLKDGLHRLFCLVPYEIITPEIWDHVMPHWMDAVVNDVPEKELSELKIILSKILDSDMSPLGIDPSKMYNFIAARFERTSSKIQEQALRWLQVLTVLEITIPLSLLFKIFENGVCVLKEGQSEPKDLTEKGDKTNAEQSAVLNNTQIATVVEDESGSTSLSDDVKHTRREFQTDAEYNLSACILMLDLLLKQMDLQQIDTHTGITSNLCKDVTRLLKCMVTASWISNHKCGPKPDCSYCEFSIMWHQLSLQLINFLSPVKAAHPPDPQMEENADDTMSRKSPPEGDKKDAKPDVVINMPIPEIHSVGGVLVHMPHVCSIMTATVETVSEQLDLAAIIPAEKVVSAVARAITLSEADVGLATVQVSKAQVMNDDQPVEPGPNDNLDDFWLTSLGKFRFIIDELPQYLQYIYQLLSELPKTKNPDILYYMLQCLNILCLNGDAFTKASKEHKGFFIWAQENVLIKNLWNLCDAEYSHISQVTVPLLLHCITLPAGSDVFWRVIQEDFHNADWKVRFVAVERVTIIARFMDSTPLRSIQSLQAALATAFCYLINSIDDVNVFVAQRATLYLGTIHDTAIKSLVLCLETQFDMVIVDRPMVLQSLYQLHNSLGDRKILTWDFFLNRFDTLFLEAQINLEKSGDISYLRDLKNTDLNSEVFLRKLHRAHEALSQSEGSATSSVKTLSASFGTKWPYKRTMSAPASIVPRQDVKQEKEKVYSRQYSAPILKRKSSRFGLDGHIHSFNMLEDGNMMGFLHRVIDLEEADRETMHLLIFLLMQFLSRSDQAYPTDEKHISKSQNIVLRHLFLLLGYNQNERGLCIPPQRLRTSPVFSAYLSNLPQLLDQNHLMGWMLLNTSLLLLQYCPSPHFIPGNEHQQPGYSLWALEPHARHCWLMSLVVLLYKYQYGQQPQSQQLQALVRIVLNTLDAQNHHCRRIPATVVMGAPPSRSRDVSQPSLGADNEPGDRMNTPPLSPMYSVEGQVTSHVSVSTKPGKMQVAYHQKPSSTATASMETHWEEAGPILSSEKDSEGTSRAHLDSCTNADETESELVTIPESDLSDSTLHGSVHDSFDENIEENDFNIQVKSDQSHSKDQVDNKVTSQSMKSFTNKRPTWFIGSEEESLQSNKKMSIQEGMKMIVSSNLLGNNVEKQSFKVNNNKGCSKQSPFGTSGLAGTVAAIAGVSPMPVAKPMTTDSFGQTKTSSFEMKQNDNYLYESKINYQIYSRIFVEKPKRAEVILSPLCTPASDSTSDSSSTQQCDDSQRSWSDQGSSQNNQHLFPTPSIERLLPIGAQRSVSKVIPKQIINEGSGTMRSPESPLSKMDVHSIDSSKEFDTENNSPEHMHSGIESQLDIPVQERLLLVGPHSKEINQLVEKVKLALGVQSMAVSSSDKNGNDTSSRSPKPKTTNQLSKTEESSQSRSISPRRLIKQVALESPPNALDLEQNSALYKHICQENKKEAIHTQRQKIRKTGSNTNSQGISNNMWHPGSWFGPTSATWPDLESQQFLHATSDLKQSSFRIGDECVSDRCSECGILKEEYSDEEIGLCIIILSTFIHREPALAAPMLPDILTIVSKVAINAMYPWQNETNIHLPGGAVSVAHQFLRCVLHQLAPNGVFIQMFQTQATDVARTQFFRSVSQALLDFNELNSIAPLQFLLESLNSKKTLGIDTLPVIIRNMACYLDCLQIEAGMGPTTPMWSTLLAQLEILFRRIIFLLHSFEDIVPLLKIMVSVLKIPGIAQYKGILDPFSKVLGHALQTQPIQYHFLVDLCLLCNRAFTRERDKLILCRMVIFELVQALKFKTSIPDTNFLMLVNVVLQDVGGHVPNSVVLNSLPSFNMEYNHLYSTSISDCMRLHLGDILDFLTDYHALNKIKSYSKGTNVGLNDDTLGGIIKSSMAQYVALEITRSNGRDNRAVVKYFPWLYSTSAMQQGAREFIDCIGHIRLLSWLLLGSLTHSAIYGTNNQTQINHAVSQPIPQEASCQIADHIQVIMAGFAEQPKASILHMSSLFHAFILCQLWTVYLEQGMSHNMLASEASNITLNILFDFWGKVTPCILQLVSHSKTLSEMVSLHFLYMLEALLECRSTFLCKLLPLWTPVLYSHHIQLPGHLQVRLQNCRNYPPFVNNQVLPNKNKQLVSNPTLLKWLQKLQFKMGQIELQSSAATQFYSL